VRSRLAFWSMLLPASAIAGWLGAYVAGAGGALGGVLVALVGFTAVTELYRRRVEAALRAAGGDPSAGDVYREMGRRMPKPPPTW
jgi:hypothetical protein